MSYKSISDIIWVFTPYFEPSIVLIKPLFKINSPYLLTISIGVFIWMIIIIVELTELLYYNTTSIENSVSELIVI